MTRRDADDEWLRSNSAQDSVREEEEEGETLSLCDLPINDENESGKEAAESVHAQEDFDFGSWSRSASTESEMCAADDVFFQGRILPFRHSVSSESGLALFRTNSRNPTSSGCISRSESMDHRYSGGFGSASSRSSSIRSHNSSSSGSSTAVTTPPYGSRLNNRFHSHPSPTPQNLRASSTNQYGSTTVNRSSRKSTMWSFFRVGLVRAPEIGLQDPKFLNNNRKSNQSFGSQNSNGSSSASSLSFGKFDSKVIDNEKMGENTERKKQGWFQINGTLFGGGCKCSVEAIDQTVPSRAVVMIKNGRISANARAAGKATPVVAKKTKKPHHHYHRHQEMGKQSMSSRLRTFEWLKELSLEAVPNDS